MKTKRILYWTALAVTGAAAVALRLWAVQTWGVGSASPWGWGPPHHFGPPGGPPLFFGLPLIVLLAVGLALWYRRKNQGPWADPWEALGMEYVEGRIQRDEFMARRAVLEELKWK